MSEKKIFVVWEQTRERICQYIRREAPESWLVTVQEPGKSRAQEAHYHAQIGDIAKQWKFMGKYWHREDVKRLLVDAFAQAMREAGTPLHHDGRVMPSLDGMRVVQLGIQTSEFRKREAGDFIEWLYAFGEEQGVQWSDSTRSHEQSGRQATPGESGGTGVLGVPPHLQHPRL